MVFWVILQYNFPTLPIAPAETMQPFCVPALLVLVRGRLGLAAVAVLCTWRGRSRIFGRLGLDFLI